MYQVLRRATDSWQIDNSADNPSRPYGERTILDVGGEHLDLTSAAIEVDARNSLLAETERARWSIHATEPEEAEYLDGDLAAVDIEAAQVGDWLEAHGEDRALAD